MYDTPRTTERILTMLSGSSQRIVVLLQQFFAPWGRGGRIALIRLIYSTCLSWVLLYDPHIANSAEKIL